MNCMESMKDFYDENTNSFRYEANSKDFWDGLRTRMENKEVITGKVVGFSHRGLTVELNDFKAFMPISMVSMKRQDSLEQYLDQDIDFMIMEVKPEKQSVIISHREVEFQEKRRKKREAISQINAGLVFEGTVESLTDYGAFVDIGNDITGLLHVSQISHERVKSPKAVLEVGQKIKVQVIKNDNGRISLSMKALEKNPKMEFVDEDAFDMSSVTLPTGDASTSLAELLSTLKLPKPGPKKD